MTKQRDAYLRKYYNVTLEDYEKLLNRQRQRCFICHRAASIFRQSLSVDHCHVSGRVRGLLCHQCNRGLRYFSDNAEYLRRAAKHVQRDPLGIKVPKKYLKGRPKRRKKKKNK